MLDALPNIPWETIGPWGIVTIAVISILRGWIIPRSTWQDWQRIHNDRLSDARNENSKLHETIKLQNETISANTSQLEELLEYAKLTEALLSTLSNEGVKRATKILEKKPGVGARDRHR
jgi:hypothetical protein